SRIRFMSRISLRTIAITFPVIFAIVFALWLNRLESQREQTLKSYAFALKTGRTLPLAWLERDFGLASARKRVRESAHEEDELHFDGKTRVVQILRDYITEHGETGDAISLYTFGDGVGTIEYHAPVGGKIDRVQFKDGSLKVTLHGNLRMGSFGFNIDELDPQTYTIEWLADATPDTNLYWLIWETHQHEVFRLPGR
ncbi:MAG: hypothetical protein AAF802_30135, partial [Planctomycetota bacterium]